MRQGRADGRNAYVYNTLCGFRCVSILGLLLNLSSQNPKQIKGITKGTYPEKLTAFFNVTETEKKKRFL
jgi:hypothetical protein